MCDHLCLNIRFLDLFFVHSKSLYKQNPIICHSLIVNSFFISNYAVDKIILIYADDVIMQHSTIYLLQIQLYRQRMVRTCLGDLHLTCVKALQGHRAQCYGPSSMGRQTMGENNVSTSTNTDEL